MKPVTIHGAPEGFDALLVARRRAEIEAPIAHVCRDDARMARMAEALGFFAPEPPEATADERGARSAFPPVSDLLTRPGRYGEIRGEMGRDG